MHAQVRRHDVTINIHVYDSNTSFYYKNMGAGTIFRLGEQKLNDFSVREAKIGEKQSRLSNSKCNFMQYVFFGTGEFSRIFVLKVSYQSVSYRKKLGSRMY